MRILLDLSHTIKSRHCSGIQMVVRKLAELLPDLAATGQVECIPVIFRQGKFWTTSTPARDCMTTFEQTRDQFLSRFFRIARIAQSKTTPPVGRKLETPHRHSSDASGLGLLSGPLNAYWKWNRYRLRRFGFCREVDCQAGDLLLLPDGYWNLKEIWEAVAEAKTQGVKTACLLYDLVCLTHPQFVTPRMQTSFAIYLDRLVESADFILTISEDVKRQLGRLAEAGAFPGPLPPVEHFRLGADGHRALSPPRPELARVLQNAPHPYVMVATLEPRKNHEYVLDAFDHLWREHPQAKLLLAGRSGWNCEQVLRRIRKHPKFQKQLYLFHDLTNSEIAHCYDHARAVILASFAEGFGLPIVEGQWHGRQVLASDTSVHREVGGKNCRYFDHADPLALVRELKECEQRKQLSFAGASASRPDTWKDSIGSLILKLVEFSNRETARSAQSLSLPKAA